MITVYWSGPGYYGRTDHGLYWIGLDGDAEDLRLKALQLRLCLVGFFGDKTHAVNWAREQGK